MLPFCWPCLKFVAVFCLHVIELVRHTRQQLSRRRSTIVIQRLRDHNTPSFRIPQNTQIGPCKNSHTMLPNDSKRKSLDGATLCSTNDSVKDEVTKDCQTDERKRNPRREDNGTSARA